MNYFKKGGGGEAKFFVIPRRITAHRSCFCVQLAKENVAPEHDVNYCAICCQVESVFSGN